MEKKDKGYKNGSETVYTKGGLEIKDTERIRICRESVCWDF